MQYAIRCEVAGCAEWRVHVRIVRDRDTVLRFLAFQVASWHPDGDTSESAVVQNEEPVFVRGCTRNSEPSVDRVRGLHEGVGLLLIENL